MKAWKEFVSQQPLQPLDENNAICSLEQTAILYVGGDDASEFLQNQLSNDIRKIDEHHSQLSSMSNAKGRMLGIFQVIRIDGGYLLLMPQDIVADIGQALRKFILMSKVVLADISESFAQISLTSSQAELFDHAEFPAEIHAVTQTDSLICLRLPAAPGRHRLLLMSNDENEAIALWQQFSNTLPHNDENHWRLQQIDAGIPTVYASTAGAFVLQMSNLQLLDGVSFKKGCYPGQEVVARMQYLGKLKRRMYRAKIDSGYCPAPADKLCSKQAEAADNSGQVVDAVRLDDEHCRLLLVAQIAKAEAGDLVICGHSEDHLDLLDLPYSFETD